MEKKKREWWLLVRNDGDAIGAAKSEAQAIMKMDSYLQRFPTSTYTKKSRNVWMSDFEVVRLVHVVEETDGQEA